MNVRERFKAVFDFRKPDRLPMIEWAYWWDKTVRNWESQGMPNGMDRHGLFDFFGLDMHHQFSPSIRSDGFPGPQRHGGAVLRDKTDYDLLKGKLYGRENIRRAAQEIKGVEPMHSRGETAVWITLEGFFWYPRTLFGIESHLTAFYDYPDLMHEMNGDLLAFNIEAIDEICKITKPDFMTFAEDMSYNNGPMCSKGMFDEFMAPYYRKIVPVLKENGVKIFIDTDGFVEPMIPWFMEVGIEGILPLERQAGVDVNRIRANYPDFLIIGAFDKMEMRKDKEAMRAEFDRILPAMRSGGYIPGVDHQTPPDVSLESYWDYLSLLKEYAEKAVN